MCRFIGSNIAVGNALLTLIATKAKEVCPKKSSPYWSISFDEIIPLIRDSIPEGLEKEDCYVKFSSNPIVEFETSYPNFVTRPSSESREWKVEEGVESQLRSYFRDGLSEDITRVFENAKPQLQHV